MAEITVYRATATAGRTFQGEVYSFTPFEDDVYHRSLPSHRPALGVQAEAMLVRENTELTVTVPDELLVQHIPHERPAVRASDDGTTYNAWGLVRQVIERVPGFSMREKTAESDQLHPPAPAL